MKRNEVNLIVLSKIFEFIFEKMLSSTSLFQKFFAQNLEHFEGSFEEFKGLLKNTKGLVVVDFYADWCGPCKNLGRILPQIAEKHPNVTFLKANVDESTELAEHYRVEVIPQIKFFKEDTKELNTVVGSDPYGVDRICTELE